ncbi:mpv17-like protein [Drosophila eugracilis]|uniref:mpv17-like protein n=1 Tax=Drosophila eugracilis TaxID=29029 RepID=UPI0007E748E3|nr:mpv17-like protein [Drosophila eugracilis]
MSALKAYLKEIVNVAAVMGLGDMVAQFGIEKKPLNEWDTGRTLRFGALGLVFVGPVLRQWYIFLESRVPKTLNPMRRCVTKMLADQCIIAPPFTLAMSFLVPLVNGEPADQIRKRIFEYYPSLLARNYMLWPAAQLINFRFVPLSHQVLYVQCVALIWNSYLSLVLNKTVDPHPNPTK